jgi:hypothetical protein
MELDFDCSGNLPLLTPVDIEEKVDIDDAFSLEDQVNDPQEKGSERKQEFLNSD